MNARPATALRGAAALMFLFAVQAAARERVEMPLRPAARGQLQREHRHRHASVRRPGI